MRTKSEQDDLLSQYRNKIHTAVHHASILKKGALAYIGFIMYSYDQAAGAPCIILTLLMIAFIESLLCNLLEIDNS